MLIQYWWKGEAKAKERIIRFQKGHNVHHVSVVIVIDLGNSSETAGLTDFQTHHNKYKIYALRRPFQFPLSVAFSRTTCNLGSEGAG